MLYNIEKLVWDEWNREHITKHNVSVSEVNEACYKPMEAYKSYQNRLIILGKTKNKRLLTIVLMKKEKGIFYIVTARDMSRRERKLINEK
jgi:uncharacterized DUF497 family protein